MGSGMESRGSPRRSPREGPVRIATTRRTGRPVGWLVLAVCLLSGPIWAQRPAAPRPAGRFGTASAPIPAPMLPETAGSGSAAAPTPTALGMTPLPDGESTPALPANPPGVLGRLGEVLPLPEPRADAATAPPGMPTTRGRPRPGSIFDPGATGPGISQVEENFLDNALDPAPAGRSSSSTTSSPPGPSASNGSGS